ncbi:MAG: NifB/NifX family molybdenum-iron cluster-binding protein [Candidatus Jordarchaeum sp.]|uniref:NifB/NifX family molybdenum-iron cluster-binding protein n=1 Tax=Candidatus Jordarchaeum sp. TaxID=2823881 RepID=UPI00404A59EE
MKMKIAFASEENKGLESMVAQHFGRCPYYIFVDVEGNLVKTIETKENPYFNSHEPGVVPQFIAKENANVIIAGGMGPRAIEWFEKLGVQPITGISGKVKDALDKYLGGKLSGAGPCDEHS